MQPKHYTTRLFVGLFIITMLLTYVALALTEKRNNDILNQTLSDLATTPPKQQATAPVPETPELLDTTGWSTYKDKTFPITFEYPKGWQVASTPTNKNGFYDITIKPSDKSANLHISISKKDFLGLDGLKQDPYTLGNFSGTSVNDTLIGVKAGENYYTFDGSLNSKKMPEFQTIMSTVILQ